jgi:hypothetical protein
MVRRWLIRAVFMLPILLCVGGWGWSARHGSVINYRQGERYLIGSSLWGSLDVSTGGGMTATADMPEGWQCGELRYAHTHFFWPNDRPDSTFLGFRIGNNGGMSSGAFFEVRVPHWSLIVVFSLVLFFVWRKTRPNPHPQSAFPVELDAPGRHA